MCCNLPLLFLSQMVKKKFLIFFCDLAMMMMKIDESKLSNYFEFINARGFDFFWLSLFTRYSPGLYMIGRVRNRNFLLKSMLFSGLKDEINSPKPWRVLETTFLLLLLLSSFSLLPMSLF